MVAPGRIVPSGFIICGKLGNPLGMLVSKGKLPMNSESSIAMFDYLTVATLVLFMSGLVSMFTPQTEKMCWLHTRIDVAMADLTSPTVQ